MKIILVLLLLTGCATTPIPTSEATPVQPSSYGQPGPNTGQVIIKRDSGAVAALCATRVLVNGRVVAEVGPSEKVTLYLEEGAHILGAWPKDFCGGKLTEIEQTVKAGATSIFRIGAGSGGDFSIMPTAF